MVRVPTAGQLPDTPTSYCIHPAWPIALKAQKLVEFLKWALTDAGAAKRAADLGYSVLPDAVRTQVLAKLSAVTCNGTPVAP